MNNFFKNLDASVVVQLNPKTNRYQLNLVVGPDESIIELSTDIKAYDFYSKRACELMKSIGIAIELVNSKNAILDGSESEKQSLMEIQKGDLMSTVIFEMKNSLDASVKITLNNHLRQIKIVMIYDEGGPSTDSTIEEKIVCFSNTPEQRMIAIKRAISIAMNFVRSANEVFIECVEFAAEEGALS